MSYMKELMEKRLDEVYFCYSEYDLNKVFHNYDINCYKDRNVVLKKVMNIDSYNDNDIPDKEAYEETLEMFLSNKWRYNNQSLRIETKCYLVDDMDGSIVYGSKTESFGMELKQYEEFFEDFFNNTILKYFKQGIYNLIFNRDKYDELINKIKECKTERELDKLFWSYPSVFWGVEAKTTFLKLAIKKDLSNWSRVRKPHELYQHTLNEFLCRACKHDGMEVCVETDFIKEHCKFDNLLCEKVREKYEKKNK